MGLRADHPELPGRAHRRGPALAAAMDVALAADAAETFGKDAATLAAIEKLSRDLKSLEETRPLTDPCRSSTTRSRRSLYGGGGGDGGDGGNDAARRSGARLGARFDV